MSIANYSISIKKGCFVLLGLLIAQGMLVGCVEEESEPPKTDHVGSSLALEPVFAHIKFQAPVALMQTPGDDTDWFLVQKDGVVLRIEKESSKESSIFVDVRDRVDASHNESGLLGMAFHPRYDRNHQMFLSYTRDGGPLTSTISRFTLGKNNKSVNPDSEEIVLQVSQPYGNHNGGHIAFGPKGNLFIGLGDGGSGGDPQGHGQNIQTLLGALLRINVDGDKPYIIPNDNPFFGSKSSRPEIYAYGLRNPWRWSFDKKTDQLWLADVGQNKWEEINLIEAGGNYGWNLKEGLHNYDASVAVKGPVIDPVSEYSHDDGCSVTGGYVYRGQKIASLEGVYIYGDFCSGQIWGLFKDKDGKYESRLLLESGLMISSFAEGNDGELYVLHYGGKIYKLVAK